MDPGLPHDPATLLAGLAAIAWTFVGAAHLALILAIVYLSLRRESLWIGLPLAFVGALFATVVPTVAIALVCLIVCVELLGRAANDSTNRWLAPGLAALGVASASVSMIKLNDGIAIVAIFVVACIALPVARRTLATVVVGSCAVAVILWVVAGQQVDDVPVFLVSAFEVVSGYSTAMGIEDPSRDWQYLGAVIGAVLLATVVVHRTRDWPRRQRIGAFLVIAIFCFLAYKEAFVRHRGGGFFEILLIVGVWALPWTRGERQQRLLLLGAFALAAMGTARDVPSRRVNVDAPGRAVQQLATLSAAASLAETIDGARTAMRAGYGIPDRLIEAIQERSVHVEPYETSVIWAYPNIDWRPLPVFQPYTAYTERLDRLNADFLASGSAPDLILRHGPASIDGRAPFLETPTSELAILCHYDQIDVSERWQLLERHDNRCGRPESLGQAAFAPGQLVAVPRDPRPGRIVVAHIRGIEAGPLAAAWAFIQKSPTWQIWRTDVGKGRLVPKRADGPLVMSVPGLLNWTGRFRPPSTPSFIVLTGFRAGVADAVQPTVTLEVAFESVPYDQGVP